MLIERRNFLNLRRWKTRRIPARQTGHERVHVTVIHSALIRGRIFIAVIQLMAIFLEIAKGRILVIRIRHAFVDLVFPAFYFCCTCRR